MSKKLLKGFLKQPASEFTSRFSASHQFDRTLFKQDIKVSHAQIKMLRSIGLLSAKEYKTLHTALNQVAKEIAAGQMNWQDELEDIHMHIEARITEKTGDTGRRIHIGRSRNDQIATDMRLYLREEIDHITYLMLELRHVLATRALEHHALLMPGFTHLQPAQPITFGHHLLAWHEMLTRDQARLADCRKRVNTLPLGAAALAGTSFPINRQFLADELGFDALLSNSLDAVSARDFITEFLAAAAICMQHLSRWSEELILWCTAQFGFVELPDHLCTGSSIMPQKKNPDLPELIRGKSARVFGNLTTLLTLMKGQPLAYNRDNQEDKEPLFDSVTTIKDCLKAWCLLAEGMQVNAQRMEMALQHGHMNATRLADYLTEKGLPFRKSYELAGQAVRLAMARGVNLQDLSPAQLQQISPLIKEDLFLDYPRLVASYDLPGGSAPRRVKTAARTALRQIAKQRERLQVDS